MDVRLNTAFSRLLGVRCEARRGIAPLARAQYGSTLGTHRLIASQFVPELKRQMTSQTCTWSGRKLVVSPVGTLRKENGGQKGVRRRVVTIVATFFFLFFFTRCSMLF